MPTQQRGVSLSEELWKWIYQNYKKLGYRFPSRFIKDCINYAIKHNPKFKNPNLEMIKEVEKYDRIGEIARERRAKKFSLVTAVKDFKEDVKGIKEAYKMGWITKEQRKEEIAKSEKHHEETIQIELSKDYGREDKTSVSREETREEKIARIKREMYRTYDGICATYDTDEEGWLCNLGGGKDCKYVYEPLEMLFHLRDDHNIINPRLENFKGMHVNLRKIRQGMMVLKHGGKLSDY